MKDEEKVLILLKKNNGIIKRREIIEKGINDKVLTRMVEQNLIERVCSGVYIDASEIEDTYFVSQAICCKRNFFK